jgi:hypothetical protein
VHPPHLGAAARPNRTLSFTGVTRRSSKSARSLSFATAVRSSSSSTAKPHSAQAKSPCCLVLEQGLT